MALAAVETKKAVTTANVSTQLSDGTLAILAPKAGEAWEIGTTWPSFVPPAFMHNADHRSSHDFAIESVLFFTSGQALPRGFEFFPVFFYFSGF